MSKPLSRDEKAVLFALESWTERDPPMVPQEWLADQNRNTWEGGRARRLQKLLDRGLIEVCEKPNADYFDCYHMDYRHPPPKMRRVEIYKGNRRVWPADRLPKV